MKDVQLYKFQEHDVVLIGDKNTLLQFAELAKNSEGSLGDLRYKIEYAFDIDGVRSENGDDDPEYAKDNYAFKSEDRIEVMLPFGKMSAWFNADKERPEVFIDLEGKNRAVLPLASVMVDSTDDYLITARIYRDLSTSGKQIKHYWAREECEAKLIKLEEMFEDNFS